MLFNKVSLAQYYVGMQQWNYVLFNLVYFGQSIARVAILLLLFSGEKAILQYGRLLNDARISDDFQTFDWEKQDARIDVVLFNHTKKYPELWEILRTLLLLSHGQDSVERGFSANKEILQPNMQAASLCAHRLVSSYLDIHGGEPTHVNLRQDQELLNKCAMAHSAYLHHQNMEKELAKASEKGLKRKRLEDEIGNLQKRLRAAETVHSTMLEQADRAVEEAHKSKVHATMAAKIKESSTLRKASKETETEIGRLKVEIDSKGKELRGLSGKWWPADDDIPYLSNLLSTFATICI